MKKVFKVVVIFLLVLVASAAIVPYVFKDDIMTLVKEEANKNVHAEIDFGDFSMSLFTNFPDFTFTIENVVVTNKAPFEGIELARIGELSFTLDVMSVFKGESINIKEVLLSNTNANIMVAPDGTSNYDIAMADNGESEDTSETTEESASDFNISLKRYALQNIHVTYVDETTPMSTTIKGLTHEGNGDFTMDLVELNTNTSIDEISFDFEGVSYLSKAAVNMKADLEVDMPNFTFTFKENRLAINQLLLGLDGWVAMPGEDMDMDLKFFAQETKLRGLMSMVPAVFTEGFEELKISGDFALDGYAKGKMTDVLMPEFGVNMHIDKGRIVYPDLPKSIDNINVKAKVVSLGGESLDNTIIDVPVAHLEIAENPIDMVLNITNPMTDPMLKFGLNAQVMLAELKDAMPLENGEELNGFISSDVKLKGRLSAIETENYEAFDATGKIEIRDMEYKAPDMPVTSIKHTLFKFSPEALELEDFVCNVGKTDINANGTIKNYLAYALKDETLVGKFYFASNKIDVNEFMTEDGVTTIDEGSSEGSTDVESDVEVIVIPKNIDFMLDANIKQLVYDNIELENTKGVVIVNNGEAKLEGISLETLGGKVLMDGFYNTQNEKEPKVNFEFGLEGLDINKTATTFNTVDKMAPIAKHCAGLFSANFTFAGLLDGKMEPKMETLYGKGGLSTKAVAVEGFKPLTKLASVLKNKTLEKPTLKNINATFKFENGRVYVDPFDVNFEDINATIQGNSGFDQTIDYKMDMVIPRDKIGGEANKLVEGLVGQANSLGANFSLGESINLKVNITNTVTDPKIKTGLGNQEKGDVKNSIKEGIENKKKELEDKAREEAEKAKQKAKEELEKKKEEARKKAEAEKKRLEEEAKKKMQEAKKKAEEEAKKKAEEEAKKALKGMFKKP